MAVREITFGEAVREEIAEEMRRDPTVFLIGEDVAEAGHPFKTLLGLVNEFGTKRIIETHFRPKQRMTCFLGERTASR